MLGVTKGCMLPGQLADPSGANPPPTGLSDRQTELLIYCSGRGHQPGSAVAQQ